MKEGLSSQSEGGSLDYDSMSLSRDDLYMSFGAASRTRYLDTRDSIFEGPRRCSCLDIRPP